MTDFWTLLEKIVKDSEIIIDRPKGTSHPKFPNFVYPADYGYLADTASMDQNGIDVWVGSDINRQIDAILCTVDRLKRDSEIKIMIGCTEYEKETVFRVLNETEFMKAILIRRH